MVLPTTGKPVKSYPNESVKRVIAFIPPGHQHLRLIIELEDQIIVLHEATVAGIVRAYIDLVTHPSRKAVELSLRRLTKAERKPGYADWQLVETGRSEDEISEEAMKVWLSAQ
jgi:hypothetical protein